MMKKHLIIVISLLTISVVLMAQKDSDTLKVVTSAQCGECQLRIETALAYTKGVKSASLNLEDKVVTIVYRGDKTTPDLLRNAIALVGYDADHVQADPVAYKKLPSCCKKPDDPEAGLINPADNIQLFRTKRN